MSDYALGYPEPWAEMSDRVWEYRRGRRVGPETNVCECGEVTEAHEGALGQVVPAARYCSKGCRWRHWYTTTGRSAEQVARYNANRRNKYRRRKEMEETVTSLKEANAKMNTENAFLRDMMSRQENEIARLKKLIVTGTAAREELESEVEALHAARAD